MTVMVLHNPRDRLVCPLPTLWTPGSHGHGQQCAGGAGPVRADRDVPAAAIESDGAELGAVFATLIERARARLIPSCSC
ncbi:MAG: hypothetical protein ACRDSZ_13390 [Pseudonocardiaceae bacterium]